MDDGIERRLAEIGRLIGDWRRSEERSAATLAYLAGLSPCWPNQADGGHMQGFGGVTELREAMRARAQQEPTAYPLHLLQASTILGE